MPDGSYRSQLEWVAVQVDEAGGTFSRCGWRQLDQAGDGDGRW